MANLQPKTVLVTGATGKQGGAVANLLLQRGHKVRALTRNPAGSAAQVLARKGAQIVEASMDDKDALQRAAEGVDAIFAVTTPFEAGMEAEVVQGRNAAEAAKGAGAHLTYSSVAWADQNTGIPHFESKWEVEKHIRSLAIPHAILGPVFFMENALSPDSLRGLQSGVLGFPMEGSLRLPEIATENIAEMAVLAIEDPDRLANRRVDIAGDALTGEQAATILSRVIGRDLRYFNVPKDGLPEDLQIMFRWYEEKQPQLDLPGLRSHFPEVQWTSYEDWARKQDWTALLS